MSLTCGGKLGMIFLIVINLLFFLLGLGLFIPGILMFADVDIVDDNITPLLQQLTFGSYNLGDLAQDLAILFICLGLFVIIVSGLGLFGACCKNRCMLVIYAIIVILLFIIKIVAVGLWLKLNSEFQDEIKSQMLSQLNNNFIADSVSNADAVSNSWNYLFISFSCCGVNAVVKGGLSGFENTKWCTTAGTDCSTGTSKIPGSCCVGITASTISSATASCKASLDSGTYYTTGCFDAVQDKIASLGYWFIGIGITILVIEVLAVIFAFCICHQVKKDGEVV